ncbi:hypothetical protein [Lysobacter humi (ex Lee et al. 2017)]
MRIALARWLLLLAAPSAVHAQAAPDAVRGFSTASEVYVDAARAYRLDDRAMPLKRLDAYLGELDRQAPVDRLILRAGKAPVTADEIADMAGIATRLGAQLLIERDGALVPAEPATR